MNDWQKTVAKFTKLHKGKSLTEILPLAKAEYRKTHKVGKIAKKPRNTKGRKKQRGGDPAPSNDDELDGKYASVSGGEQAPHVGGKRRKRRTKKSRKGKKAKKSHSRRRH